MEVQNKRIEEFDRSKVYEKLDYAPKPEGYTGKLSWIVQQQIGATNGIHYIDRVGKLTDYPTYELPIKKVAQGLMLDIGTGWGRWLVAGANKGYIPIGADIRLEFCKTALNTLKDVGKNGYTVVADLKDLPFHNNIFDFVWSFSVVQHTHKERMISCLKNIHRILGRGGYTLLEFPNRNGFRNYYGPAKSNLMQAGDYNSWVVRYYTVKEYREIFLNIFNNFYYTVHSALGIGVLKEDLKYVSLKNKILCAVSLALSGVFKIIKPLKKFADSIYIRGEKQGNVKNEIAIQHFLAAHAKNPAENLNIIHLLRCPISGEDLSLSNDLNYVVNSSGKIKYPIKNNIPILIPAEAIVSR